MGQFTVCLFVCLYVQRKGGTNEIFFKPEKKKYSEVEKKKVVKALDLRYIFFDSMQCVVNIKSFRKTRSEGALFFLRHLHEIKYFYLRSPNTYKNLRWRYGPISLK